jgi:crotonobetainyl-CoA:carnitine CoA-transferase CaiB-like acyl-CoA transferase
MKPLEGIKVIDLTHMLAGPHAGMVLADLGAEVIKIEPLHTGEMTRSLLSKDSNYSFKGFGAYFLTLNRNKKSVAIDLKNKNGLKVFYDLVTKADVVINNFSAGVIKKLKIDYFHLSKINPSIITCSITGFGESGPNHQRPAYDNIIQGFSGGMSITGKDSSNTVRAGIPIADLGGGLYGVIGILSSLIAREKMGKGQHIDISLLDVQISLLSYMITMHTLSGLDPTPIGNAHFVHVPFNSFTTKDGYIVIAVITNEFWQSLREVVCIKKFYNHEFDDPMGRLRKQKVIEDLLNEKLKTNTTDYWLEKLQKARVPCGPINSFSKAISDEQVLYRKMIVEVNHPDGGKVKMPGNPIKMSMTNENSFSPPPHLGQHTSETLRSWCNYNKTKIKDLIKKKIIT